MGMRNASRSVALQAAGGPFDKLRANASEIDGGVLKLDGPVVAAVFGLQDLSVAIDRPAYVRG
jgi:hypothetical protein